MILTSAKVLDYSESYFIAIKDGDATIYDDFKYIVHRTNLTEYEQILAENMELLKNFMDKRETDLIMDQNRQIQRSLRILFGNKRHARSLDFIGSALKFIAGTPDRNDFDLLKTKDDMLIQNNNRQTVVNSALQDKINELTERINLIQRGTKDSNVINTDELLFLELLSTRNGEIIFFLNQLTLSITLAKKNVVNPVILDNAEISYILENEMIPVNLNSLLKASSVSVYQTNNTIYYIMKVPMVKRKCKLLKIYPVVHNNTVITGDFLRA